MLSKLSYYQLKTACYNYKIFFVSFMITTKETSVVNIYKIMIKKSKHTTPKVIKSQRKTAREEARNKKDQKTMKMAIASSYLSIITLHVNQLNSLIKRHKMAE